MFVGSRRVFCWGHWSRYNVLSGPILGVDTVFHCTRSLAWEAYLLADTAVICDDEVRDELVRQRHRLRVVIEEGGAQPTAHSGLCKPHAAAPNSSPNTTGARKQSAVDSVASCTSGSRTDREVTNIQDNFLGLD